MTSSTVVTAQPVSGVRRATTTFAWLNLVGQIVIVFTGGLVRLTGSGLGCSTWPQCEPGSFTPVFHEASSIHPYVEFGNRTLTGVLTVFAVGLVWTAWREKGRGRGFKLLATVPLALIVVQAVIGGLSVLAKLDPSIVGFHLLLSVVLVWVSAVIVVRGREGDATAVPLVPRRVRTLGWVMAVFFVPVVTLGVITTGAGPHSGDDVHGFRFAIDPTLAARIHSGAVWLFAVLLLCYVIALHRVAAPARAKRAAWWLVAALAAQGMIGYVQLAAGLPVPLVALHLLGLALTTTALAFAVLATRRRDALQPSWSH